MDYKKLHEETLTALQQMVSEGKITEEIARSICADFVKESGDEGIRKSIIDLVEKQMPKSENKKWMIAWLEKQDSIGKINEKLRQYREYLVEETERWHKKEEDKTLSKIGKQDCIGHANAYVSARAEFEDLFNYDSWLEKQVDQKPADKVEPKFKVKYGGGEYNVLEVRDIAGVTFYGIEDEPNHIDYVLPENCEIVSDYGYGVKEKGSPYPTKSAMFSEQKPTEDNCKISDCDTKVDMTEYNKGFECGKQRVLKYPEDFNLCEKSDSTWSEEDEKMFILCASSVKTRYNDGLLTCNEYEQASLWLKSLKERYTWKPSNEQMEALYTYIYNPQYFNSPDPRMEFVESVYKDLKKLKEE